MNRIIRKLTGLLLCTALLFCTAGAEYHFTEDADAVERTADSVFMLEVFSNRNQAIATGSGFLAFGKDLLVTNYHVIEDAAYLIAVSDDYREYYIDKLCVSDASNDLAILRFDEAPGAAALEFDAKTKLKRSQPVLAIGSPAGLMNTISIGNISAFYKSGGKDWIQFTAPISAGSSGGALLNDAGKVIGITTATYASAQNVNMAVRAEKAIALFNKWDGRSYTQLSRKLKTPVTAASHSHGTGKAEDRYVYVSGKGTKYHSNPNCSGMSNAAAMELQEALQRGYTPCGKCYR